MSRPGWLPTRATANGSTALSRSTDVEEVGSTNVARGRRKTVGQEIQRFREDKGMSINGLAAATGISKSYLWSLENDATATRPSGDTLYKIAGALGVTMSALLGRELLVDPPSKVPRG